MPVALTEEPALAPIHLKHGGSAKAEDATLRTQKRTGTRMTFLTGFAGLKHRRS
jgi:hypothetical protein